MNCKNFKIKYSDITCKGLLWLVTFAFAAVLALKLNIPPVIDEVATMANSAYLMGYDWTQTLYAMGGYYFKCGVALLYYPLMRVFEDPYVLYKAILLLNCVFLGFIPVLAYGILTTHLGLERKYAFVPALTTGIFPSTILYTMYARSDAMLMFLPWLMLYIILELIGMQPTGFKSAALRRGILKRMLLSLLLAFTGVYAYMSHTRGLVLIIAIVLAVILIRFCTGRQTVEWISFFASLAIFLLIENKISDVFYEALYGRYGTMVASAESYDFASLKLIFTGDGFRYFMRMFAGMALNMLASGYGLAGFAVIGGTAALIMYFRRRSTATNAEAAVIIFMLLSFLGTFAMGCIYFFPYIYDYFTGTLVDRADRLVYGRYAACSVGIPVLYGMYLLITRGLKDKQAVKESVNDKAGTAGTAAGGGSRAGSTGAGNGSRAGGGSRAVWFVVKLLTCLFIAVIYYVYKTDCAQYLDGVSAVSRNIIQICTFLRVEKRGVTTAVFPNLPEAVWQAALLGAGIWLLLLLLSSFFVGKKARAVLIAAVVAAASLTLTVVNYDKIRLSRDETLMTWTGDISKLVMDTGAQGMKYPVLVDSSAKDIKHYQYQLKGFVCGNNDTDAAEADNSFIIAKKKYYLKQYFADDYYTFADYDYAEAAKDIVYVKGEKLKQELEDMGFAMKKYTGKLK